MSVVIGFSENSTLYFIDTESGDRLDPIDVVLNLAHGHIEIEYSQDIEKIKSYTPDFDVETVGRVVREHKFEIKSKSRIWSRWQKHQEDLG